MPTKERNIQSPRRFRIERKGAYIVPEGTFESALMVVKKLFGDQTLGVSDTSFWSQYETKVTMEPKEACFQYFLSGTGHRVLATKLLNSFQTYRSGVSSGSITTEQKEELLGRLSNRLYELYPPKYRKDVKR